MAGEYAAGAATAATESCIAVNTQAAVDGDVTVRLGRETPAAQKEGGQMVFRGNINTPGMKLAVVTSERETILDTKAPGGRTTVAISVDDPSGARVIVVEVP